MSDAMPRRRARLIVEVDLDPVPGWGNDPNDWVDVLTSRMSESWYHPTVRLDCVIEPERSIDGWVEAMVSRLVDRPATQ